jgi:inorganic phosphate transporter, PiT family
LSLLSILFYPALFLAVALVSGNNLSACVGAAVGARIISIKFGFVLGIVGFILGLLTLGHNMTGATRALGSNISSSDSLVTEILLATVFIFILGNMMRVPLSNSMSLVGLLLGISLADHLPIDGIYLTWVFLVWLTAPLVVIFVLFLFIREVIPKTSSKKPWSRAKSYKVLIIAGSFLTAFASGTNSIALIVAVSGFGIKQLLVTVIAIIVGSVFLSRGQIRRVGTELLMLNYSSAFLTLLTSTCLIVLANVFGIPLSGTQTLSSGVFGAGMSYKHRFISVKPFVLIVAGWIIAVGLSLAIGFLIIR